MTCSSFASLRETTELFKDIGLVKVICLAMLPFLCQSDNELMTNYFVQTDLLPQDKDAL